MKYYWPLPAVLIILLISQAELFAEEQPTSPKNRFTTVATGVILDSQTGLMWPTKGNGTDIDWDGAEKFCADFEAGGFKDWRLPRQKELESLYDPQATNSSGFHITNQICLTACCPWAAEYSLNSAAIFSFRSGKRPWGFKPDTRELRALPVRGGKPLIP